LFVRRIMQYKAGWKIIWEWNLCSIHTTIFAVEKIILPDRKNHFPQISFVKYPRMPQEFTAGTIQFRWIGLGVRMRLYIGDIATRHQIRGMCTQTERYWIEFFHFPFRIKQPFIIFLFSSKGFIYFIPMSQ
jgi:hypothetical protein